MIRRGLRRHWFGVSFTLLVAGICLVGGYILADIVIPEMQRAGYIATPSPSPTASPQPSPTPPQNCTIPPLSSCWWRWCCRPRPRTRG